MLRRSFLSFFAAVPSAAAIGPGAGLSVRVSTFPGSDQARLDAMTRRPRLTMAETEETIRLLLRKSECWI